MQRRINAAMGDLNRYDRFEMLYAQYQRGVGHYLTRLCGDPEVAKELAQEAFLRAFKYLDGYDAKRENESGWIYRIARNVFVDYRVRIGKRLDSQLPGAFEDIETAADPRNAVAEHDEQELRGALAKLVRELPVPERDVLILHKVRGLSVEQTARQLGISKRTVNRKLSAALFLLKGRLTEAGFSVSK